jgi:hypothetical protein
MRHADVVQDLQPVAAGVSVPINARAASADGTQLGAQECLPAHQQVPPGIKESKVHHDLSSARGTLQQQQQQQGEHTNQTLNMHFVLCVPTQKYSVIIPSVMTLAMHRLQMPSNFITYHTCRR